jgi:tetratricopeptide (TPR) repeat protein
MSKIKQSFFTSVFVFAVMWAGNSAQANLYDEVFAKFNIPSGYDAAFDNANEVVADFKYEESDNTQREVIAKIYNLVADRIILSKSDKKKASEPYLKALEIFNKLSHEVLDEEPEARVQHILLSLSCNAGESSFYAAKYDEGKAALNQHMALLATKFADSDDYAGIEASYVPLSRLCEELNNLDMPAIEAEWVNALYAKVLNLRSLAQYNLKKYADARDGFALAEKVVRDDDFKREIVFNAALVERDDKQFDAARKKFESLVEHERNATKKGNLNLEIARAFYNDGFQLKAADYYRAALPAFDTYFGRDANTVCAIYREKTHLYLQNKRFPDMAKNLERLKAELSGEYKAGVAYELGEVYRYIGKFSEASNNYQIAIKHWKDDPKVIPSVRGYGQAELMHAIATEGDLAKAQQILDEAFSKLQAQYMGDSLKEHPEYFNIKLAIAQYYLAKGDADNAADHFARANNCNSSDYIKEQKLLYKVRGMVVDGEYVDAMSALETFIGEKSAKDMDPMNELGFYLLMGDIALAQESGVMACGFYETAMNAAQKYGMSYHEILARQGMNNADSLAVGEIHGRKIEVKQAELAKVDSLVANLLKRISAIEAHIDEKTTQLNSAEGKKKEALNKAIAGLGVSKGTLEEQKSQSIVDKEKLSSEIEDLGNLNDRYAADQAIAITRLQKECNIYTGGWGLGLFG